MGRIELFYIEDVIAERCMFIKIPVPKGTQLLSAGIRDFLGRDRMFVCGYVPETGTKEMITKTLSIIENGEPIHDFDKMKLLGMIQLKAEYNKNVMFIHHIFELNK